MEELELYSPRNCVKIEGIPRRNPRRSRRNRVKRLGREVVNSLMSSAGGSNLTTPRGESSETNLSSLFN